MRLFHPFLLAFLCCSLLFLLSLRHTAGEMQKNYVHGVPKVPKDKKQVGNNQVGEEGEDRKSRMVIVFRHGKQVFHEHDTGKIQVDLSPPEMRRYRFGKGDGIEGLEGTYMHTSRRSCRRGIANLLKASHFY